MPFYLGTVVNLRHVKSTAYFKICFVSVFFFFPNLDPGLSASLIHILIKIIRTKGVRRMGPQVSNSEKMVVHVSKARQVRFQTK